jgi:predicted Kef-type K+ transport protein
LEAADRLLLLFGVVGIITLEDVVMAVTLTLTLTLTGMIMAVVENRPPLVTVLVSMSWTEQKMQKKVYHNHKR